MGARYYQAKSGRFTQTDPVDGWSYHYGNSNPVNYTDPTGMWPCALNPSCVAENLGNALDEAANSLGDLLDQAGDAFGGGAWDGGGTGGFGGGSGGGAAEFCSFSADTLVTTDKGRKPIGEIEVGDHVLAYNPDTGETGYYTVKAVLVHEDTVIEHLTIDGERIETTPEHPFYTREHGWVTAGGVWEGAHIRKADGSYGVVERIEIERRTKRMYNLTVDEAHTFFVGEQQLLVHNQCGVPQAAYDTLAFLDSHNYSPPPNYTGGRVYQNWNGTLPAGGNYREYDIYPSSPGVNRGPERLVVDIGTGASWYTADHYASFTQIR